MEEATRMLMEAIREIQAAKKKVQSKFAKDKLDKALLLLNDAHHQLTT